MFNNASHGYFIKLLKLMALCAVGNLKTDSLKRLEVKVYTVLPMENNFLFIFVTQFEHGEASVSAACKWPGCLCLGSTGDANVSIGLSLECNSDSSGVHTNMNLYLMRWALSFKCIQTNQRVTGLPTLPLQSRALCVWGSSRKPHNFLSCHWTLKNASCVFIICLQKSSFLS